MCLKSNHSCANSPSFYYYHRGSESTIRSLAVAALFYIFAALIFCCNSFAVCKNVYTIGAYDEGFANHAEITKLGPLPANEVPATAPKSFLEKDGSYGGGEAFCKIKQACRALTQQLEIGILLTSENWHIYLLDADWDRDTYKLHPNDFRISHSVRVLKLVRENCQ